MNKFLTLITFFSLMVCGSAAAQTNVIIENADQAELLISENIYGQFSEHLGRDIYEGIWVSPGSDIPSKGGSQPILSLYQG